MSKLRLLDLFSGIGGFSLGLERSGYFETVAFCEIEPFCRRVLAKHWPKVPCYDDVRTLTAARLAADGITVDAICGGFPCQDISKSGKGAGLSGSRSGLWFEYSRLICELRPQFIVVENVDALLHRGLDTVLGTLAEGGYDAEWDCVPASFAGLRQTRNRVWIVAYPESVRPPAIFAQLGLLQTTRGQDSGFAGSGSTIDSADAKGLLWASEPDVVRVADGISERVDRLHALGNAVVPRIPELIGRAIGKSMEASP